MARSYVLVQTDIGRAVEIAEAASCSPVSPSPTR